MNTEHVTYAKLEELLHRHEFRALSSRKRKVKAYQHARTQTLVLLTERQPEEFVQAADVLLVKRQLVDSGIMQADAFRSWLAAA